MSSMEGGVKKIGFSLASNKKGKKKGSTKAAAAAAIAFGDPEEDQNLHDHDTINNDIPKIPLVIPCKQDSRQSLQEQARAKRENTTTTTARNAQPPDVVSSNGDTTIRVPNPESKDDSNNTPVVVKTEDTTSGSATVSAVSATPTPATIKSSSDEDQAAIKALERDAAVAQGKGVDWNGAGDANDGAKKRVIAANGDTFQRGGKVDDDQKKFEADIDELPQDISVRSQVYKSVPISEFGAAMLRGMGWNGNNNNNNDNNRNKKNQASDVTTMPRPSRLGLGATPKIMGSGDLPDTHSRRRPRRHDQVQREERLKQQQEEMEKERQRQVSLDKQRVLQVGSIVYALQKEGRRKRAVLKKLTGVPGLNMILVHCEGDSRPIKIKKGSIELVPRTDLNERPYRHAAEEDEEAPPRKSSRSSEKDNTTTRRTTKAADDRNHRDSERRDRGDRRSTDRERDTIDDDRRRDRDRDRDRQHSDRDRDRDRDRHKRKRDDERRRDDEKRHRSKQSSSSAAAASSSSWLIPNIRVRVISSRYGDTTYKQKGVVVDVTRKGVATLTMGNGQVINVAERHLETALPKVGGSSIVLSGNHRFSKGRLLERDSKKNRGSIQVFEDMSIVTTSLDDMAEWCGPLDDDLEH
jgi:type II secretory pathway pseudopilin PulG